MRSRQNSLPAAALLSWYLDAPPLSALKSSLRDIVGPVFTLTDWRQKVLKYAYAAPPALACMQKPPLRFAGNVKLPPPFAQSNAVALTLNVRFAWKLPQLNFVTFPTTSWQVGPVPSSPEIAF